MEKLRNIKQFATIADFFERRMSGGDNTNLFWRMLIGITLLLAVLLGVFSFFTYQWATESPPEVHVSRSRVSFSIDELREVISLYQKKSDEFKTFQQTRPEAPRLERVTNTSVPEATPPQISL